MPRTIRFKLYQIRKINNYFDGRLMIIKSLIILNSEINEILEIFHSSLCHIGIHRLQYEVERRGLFIHNITDDIKKYTKNCEVCITHKYNKFLKPANIQILSKKPLERIQIDITYF